MAVKRLTFHIIDDTVSGRSSADVWANIDEEIEYIDPDFITPLPSDRCVDTKMNTRSVFKSVSRHLRPGDNIWVGGMNQWPQYTKIDPRDLAWLKSKLK
jgi:hypothetical protein